MLDFAVDAERCVRCSQCVNECPVRILVRDGDSVPTIAAEDEENCMQCQHCLAICPTGALSILGRDPDCSLSLSAGGLPDLEQMTRLVRGRRSIRRYRDENVDPELVARLLATLANCPTGVNQRELTFIVIDEREVMARFAEQAMQGLAAAAEAGRLPESLAYLTRAAELYAEKGVDIVFRGAPHALIVSAPPDSPCPNQDISLALAYFELLARSAGLGTLWCGMLRMVLSALPRLKPIIGLPADHLHYAMLFGLPDVRFARTVQRDDAAAIHRVRL